MGERWVLSSDGLDAVVSVPEIEQVMRSHDDLAEVADTLISMTLERGAPDNVTVVALQVIDREELPVDEPVGPSALPDSALPDSIAAEQEVSVNTQKLPGDCRNRRGRGGNPRRAWSKSPLTTTCVVSAVPATLPEPCCTAVPMRCATTSEPTINAVDAALTNAAILRGELGSRPHQLVGAAAVATETGMIPAVTSRTLEHRATVAQRMPLTVDEAPCPPSWRSSSRRS